ncbi:MAG: DnaJ C-terminal domain-containing protein [Gammaproteobacteria bacterium]
MIPTDAYNKDYYAVMGLKPDASAHDIKMAYRRLARKYHPDLNKEADAEKNFKNLGEAYDVLKDPEKRKLYDNLRAQGPRQQEYRHGDEAAAHAWSGWQDKAAAGEFGADWFESIFGAQRQRRGADLHGSITISLQEAYSGVEKEITLPASSQISQSQTLKVKIPAGIKSEQQIRLAGKGEPGQQNNASGDLYLTIRIARDPIFDLVGNDVYLTLPIAPWEAALGATIKIPTLAGKVDLKIPPHSQGGQTLRLKKRGFPATAPGDQLVLLKVVIPQPTTQAGKELYEKMAKELAFNPRKHLENYHG